MPIYRRRKGSDIGISVRTTQDTLQDRNVEVKRSKPLRGELCNECKSKEPQGNSKT